MNENDWENDPYDPYKDTGADKQERPAYYRDDIYAPLENERTHFDYSAPEMNDAAAGGAGSTAEEPKKARRVKKARRPLKMPSSWLKYAGAALALLLLAGGGGYIGTRLATDQIIAQASASMANDMEAYLAQSGSTVLYRSVSTAGDTATSPSSINVASVTAAVENSVVEISTETVSYYSDWFGRIGQEVGQGAGSGVIISNDGYIVTCNHVIDGATSITVALHNGETYAATVVGTDTVNDLAVLKIEASGLTPAVLGNSSELVVGSAVIAIGNPLGSLGGTVTAGYISALERELTIDGQTYKLMQTDAAINGGNSGGGLFNANGELVGIVNAKAESVGVEGLGFALPVDDLKSAIEDIISYGYANGSIQLGIISVNITDQRTAIGYNVTDYGVYIVRVVEGSNAAYAGVQEGDRIISMDGTAINDTDTITQIVSSKQDGDVLALVVARDGRELSIDVTMYAKVPTDSAQVQQ